MPDGVPPRIRAAFRHGTVFSSTPVDLTGRARDFAVAAVHVAVFNLDLDAWLQPDGSFGPFTAFAAELSRPSRRTTAWAFTADLPDGRYSLWAEVTDTGANRIELVPMRRFVVDLG